jgi:hypothetical protein
MHAAMLAGRPILGVKQRTFAGHAERADHHTVRRHVGIGLVLLFVEFDQRGHARIGIVRHFQRAVTGAEFLQVAQVQRRQRQLRQRHEAGQVVRPCTLPRPHGLVAHGQGHESQEVADVVAMPECLHDSARPSKPGFRAAVVREVLVEGLGVTRDEESRLSRALSK